MDKERKRFILETSKKIMIGLFKDIDKKGPQNLYTKIEQENLIIIVQGVMNQYEKMVIHLFDEEYESVLLEIGKKVILRTEQKYRMEIEQQTDLELKLEEIHIDLRTDNNYIRYRINNYKTIFKEALYEEKK